MTNSLSRRTFLKSSTCAGGTLLFSTESQSLGAGQSRLPNSRTPPLPIREIAPIEPPETGGARWIWYPSGRCLPCTFVLFRREIHLPSIPRRASGWIAADSRYLLLVNGKRVQWGPAPFDPRWMEVDPIDMATGLRTGRNVIGSQVLFYGHGDGTWPLGKPGFLFFLDIEMNDGGHLKVSSDKTWQVHLARAWRPGQYKRWYLRALQEEFDARLYPYGWDTAEFIPNPDWLPAMELECPAGKPPICSEYSDYLLETEADSGVAALRPRSIPLLREQKTLAKRLEESCWVPK